MASELIERHSWFSRHFLWLIRFAFRLLYLAFGAPIRNRGSRRVPLRGSLLVISNHQSSSDPPCVQICCPRPIHFLSRRELFEMPNIAKMMRWWRAIPISQSKPDKGALRMAINMLKEGRCIGIFPEGGLSDDGTIQHLLPGAAMLVRQTGTACICVGIQNTRFLMENETMSPHWSGKTIRANWGEVKTFSPDATADEILGWMKSELLRLT